MSVDILRAIFDRLRFRTESFGSDWAAAVQARLVALLPPAPGAPK